MAARRNRTKTRKRRGASHPNERDVAPSIPTAFLERLAADVGPDRAKAMQQALEARTNRRALRLNPSRLDRSAAETHLGVPLKPVPFNPLAYWLPEDAPSGVGRSPLHAGGGFYMQDAAATAVAPFVDPQPGEWVIDLAAAPGGKASELAARLDGRGVLVANDVSAQRAQALHENLERLGARNAVITQAAPAELARRWGGRFHAVLLDAPCSGEGMFGKSDIARQEWSEDAVATCAVRQDDLLDAAFALLAPGGRLIYATCTLNRDENEGAIERLLKRQPDATPVNLERTAGMEPGVLASRQDVRNASVRIWPDASFGEGHFVACLKRTGAQAGAFTAERRDTTPMLASTEGMPSPLPLLNEVLGSDVVDALTPNLRIQGRSVWALPAPELPLDGLHVLAPGWRLADLTHGRWSPAHALAMGVMAHEVRSSVAITDATAAARFLRGEELDVGDAEDAEPRDSAWVWVTYQDVPLGWARQRGHRLRNLRPKRLRVS